MRPDSDAAPIPSTITLICLVGPSGDRITVDSQRAGEPQRQGTVLEIVEHDYGTSYRVAWDDGHESTFRPTPGTVHTVHPTKDAD